MRVRVNYAQLTEAQRHERSRKVWFDKEIRKTLRKASLATERRIKLEMPVDTGRARASWGHWTPGDVRQNKDASEQDAHWEEKDDDLTIEQGSNVEYIEDLNAGNSRQAPAGFLDAAEEAGQRELNKLIDGLLREW